MPPPIPVEICDPSPAWAEEAQREIARLQAALPGCLRAAHHVGSTAVPGLPAKPIFDLLPIVASVQALDARNAALAALGYQAWGEYGLPGRRYFTRDDAATGRRLVQLHCFEPNSEFVERHLAFRDYLRAHRDVARAYAAEKRRCRDLHPLDSHAYTDAKAPWIAAVLPAALAEFRAAGARRAEPG